jgi:UDP-glucose 4-epimerase
VSLRYFNAAGATGSLGEDHRPETHLIPVVLEVAAGKLPALELYGTDYSTPDGTCIRDYVHVSDLASAHVAALRALESGAASTVYNLGSERGASVREVLESVAQATGRPVPFDMGPRRPGDPARLVAAGGAIRRELGWAPRFADLDAIVTTAWNWARHHPHGYRPPTT